MTARLGDKQRDPERRCDRSTCHRSARVFDIYCCGKCAEGTGHSPGCDADNERIARKAEDA